MKELLIAGRSHFDIPMLLAAKGLGYSLITSGNWVAESLSFVREFLACPISNRSLFLGVWKCMKATLELEGFIAFYTVQHSREIHLQA